jgi:NADPH-dependent 2,4-dienoyl-CoA reductase/sulfur reductase-like enzyme
VTCAVNPAAGREKEFEVRKVEKARNVLVVGAGPAGMEAAIVAAKRGHRVTLCEKQDRVGGLLLLGSVPPHKEEIRDLVFYLNGQLERENVQVQLGREMTADSVRAMKPDVVVLAAGGIPIVPEMAKVRVDGVVTALEVLSGSKPVGQEVIVIGGGLVGGETAGYLAERGKKVTLLEMTGSIGNDVGPSVLKVFVKRLKEAGVIVETRTKAIEITDKGVTCLRDDKLEFFRGATIVLAMGMRGNSRLVRELEGKGMAVSAVGDCVEPRTIAQAMESGFRVALEIT